jgi:hypothetical protein
MLVNQDFSDLFSALNAAEARYLVVGGYAFSYHAEPRYTKDLDIWVEPTESNADAVWRSLAAFGAPTAMISVADLCAPGMVFQIGVPPNRIDLVTSIDGVSFQECWNGRVQTVYAGVPIQLIGKAELIRNKTAAGRPQDLVDVERLTRRWDRG